MFKFFKKFADSRSQKQKVIDAIVEQYALKGEILSFDGKDDVNKEIININVTQIDENIKSLESAFSSLLEPLRNNILGKSELDELLKYPIPMSVPGFVCYIGDKVQQLDETVLESMKVYDTNYIERSTTNSFDLKVNISNSNVLTKKFKKLYDRKLRIQLSKELQIKDPAGYKFLNNEEVDLESALKLISCYMKFDDIIKSVYLNHVIIKNDTTQLFNNFFSHCSNMDFVLLLQHKKDKFPIGKYGIREMS